MYIGVRINASTLLLLILSILITLISIAYKSFAITKTFYIFTIFIFLFGILTTLILDYVFFGKDALFPNFISRYTRRWKGFIWMIQIFLAYFLVILIFLIIREGIFSKISGLDLFRSLILGSNIYLWFLTIYVFLKT